MDNFYKILKSVKAFALVVLLLSFGQAMAQERTVTGKITADDGSAIPGVSIIVTGTTSGTLTDLDGNYKLNVPEGATLSISSIGFVSQKIEVGAQSVIDVVLMTETTQLSELVVIGYGEREKKDLTGAISTMNSKEIEKSASMAPELAMQGHMAGVFVSSQSANPTQRPTVRIRGVSTFGSGVPDPLYVIDGVPITEWGAGYEKNYAVAQDVRGTINVLSLINPDDIESISVLKDASAAAIYGVRAANGVIIITTKKGKVGKSKVDFSYSQGVQNIPKRLDVLGVSDYTKLIQEEYANNPNQAASMSPVYDPASPDYLGNQKFIDWQTPFLNKNAITQDASVRIYGGTEATNYYVSAGYGYQQSPFIGNDLKRYSLSSNITTKAASWVDVGVTYRLSYVDALDMFNSGSPYDMGEAFSAPPWQPIYLKDDYKKSGYEVEDKYGYALVMDTTIDKSTDPWTVNYAKKYGPEETMNQMAMYDNRLNDSRYFLLRNIGNAYVALEPIKGLRIKGTVSADWYLNQHNSRSSNDNNFFSITPGNPYAVGDGNSYGTAGKRYSQNFNLVKEITIDWVKSFGDHNINLTLNAMDQKYTYHFIGAGTNQVNTEDPDKITVGGPDQYTSVGEIVDRYALQGYMGRVSYNYASRYYVDLTVRRDGSSRFAPDYRWGTFPSVALAWRLSGESFMSGLSLINDLKIRAGWGQMGNQETRPFAYLSTVNDAPHYNYGSGGGNPLGQFGFGVKLPDFPTIDLSWETATTTNIGFDAVLWHNRITTTIEYYNRLTADILQEVDLPSSVGVETRPILNLATVRNNGFEFQLGYNDKVGDFEYSFSGNLTTVHNNVEKLWRNQPEGGEQGRIEQGYPIGYLWGFQTGGIYQSQGEVLNWWTQHKDQTSGVDSSLVSAGDMYFKDVHGDPTETEKFYSKTPDGKVNLNDRTYIGKTIPGYYYGLTFGANWKGFDISIFFQGVGDVQKYNPIIAAGSSMSSMGNNQLVDVLNRWTPTHMNTWNQKDPLGSLPRAVYADPAGNNRFSDRFVQNAGYMRLKNLTFGYTVPTTFLSKVKYIERFRVYISGTNLLTLTKFDGLDPEFDNLDFQSGAFLPVPRTWSVGINATF